MLSNELKKELIATATKQIAKMAYKKYLRGSAVKKPYQPQLRGSRTNSRFQHKPVSYNRYINPNKPSVRVNYSSSAGSPGAPTTVNIGFNYKLHQIGQGIQSGTSAGDRLGTKIYVKKVNFQGWIRNPNLTQRGWVRLLCLQNLRPTDTENEIGLFEPHTDSYLPLDYKASNGTTDGSVNQIFKRINKMGYRVLADRKYRILEDVNESNGKNFVRFNFDVPVNQVMTFNAFIPTSEKILPNLRINLMTERDTPSATSWTNPLEIHYEIREFFWSMP